MFVASDLKAARSAVETTMGALGEPAAVFAEVGCDIDISVINMIARRRVLAMVDVLAGYAEIDDEQVRSTDFIFQAETAWLNGLLVGLYLDPTPGETIDQRVLWHAACSPRQGKDQIADARLRRFGVDPGSATETALELGHSMIRDAQQSTASEGSISDCVAAFASLWLDGLSTGVQSREKSR